MTDGPAWLGIGAQRSGTTWFTDLLTQHPDVTLATNGAKELHQLYLPFDRQWQRDDIDRYRELFPGDRLAGEFTPYYLRAPWAPRIARTTVRGDAPIIVLLRDPVERYESAIRFRMKQGLFENDRRSFIRYASSDATWAGMYATQLEPWLQVFGHRRLLVFQYERVRRDPAPSVERVWRHLGLSPAPLTEVDRPSRTVANNVDWSLDQVSGLRRFLIDLYEPQVTDLRRWNIDPSLWPNFQQLSGRSRLFRSRPLLRPRH